MAALMVLGGAASFQTTTAPFAQAATTLTASDVLTNQTTLNQESIYKGQSVQVHCVAQGGRGTYQYAVYYKRSSSKTWYTAQKYNANATVSFTPTAATTYDISVKVKDAAGKVVKKAFKLNVMAVLQNNGKLSKSTILKGQSVTLKASAKGGAGGYQYAFYYKRSNHTSYSCIQEFGEANSVAITPASSLDYDVLIKVRDAKGTTVNKSLVLHVLPALKNNSKISKTTIIKGESVTLTGAASGGSEGFTYAYYYRRALGTKWTTAKAYSSSTSVDIKPATASDYIVRICAKDSMGHVDKKDIELHVLPTYKNLSALSASNIFKGESITLNGAAKGGAGGYQYAIYYKRTDSDSWVTGQAYSSNPSVTITPKYTADYLVRFKVKDALGNVLVKDLVFSVYAPLVNHTALKNTTIFKGDSLSVTGAAAGGSGGYQYAFYYKRTSQTSWTTVQKYQDNTAVKITPKAATDYEIKIRVRDSVGHVQEKLLSFTVLPVLELTAAPSATMIEKGQSVTVNLSGKGGSGGLVYAAYYKKETATKWSTAQAYEANTEIKITPKSEALYTVRVKVKDSMNHVVVKDLEVRVLSALDPLKNTSSLSSSKGTVNMPVTINGSATGGSGVYEYAYYYKGDNDNDWKLLQDYTGASSFGFTPKTAGSFSLLIRLRDSLGNTAERTRSLMVYEPLINLSSVSESAIVKGESVTVTASATGGSGEYTFAYAYKQTEQNEWTTIKDFSTDTTAAVQFTSSGSYTIRIIVRDSLGGESERLMTVDVVPELVNTSVVDATDIVKGSTVTITGSAQGGSGGYTFAYAYKQTKKSTWTTIKDFSTDTTASVRLASAVQYTIRVTVKDSLGTESEKLLYVNAVPVLTNTSTVSADSILMGESVTLSASATGGLGDYTYAYAYKEAAVSNWTVMDESGSTAVFTPAAAGTYDLCITVKDSSDTEKSKTFTLAVNRAFVNQSTASTTETTVGGRVVLTAVAEGQSTAYTHAFRYRTPVSADWFTLQDYSTDNFYTMNFNASGTYEFCVSIRDNLGNVEDKFFTVTVLENVTNLSTVDQTRIRMGESTTLHAAAVGGTGTYTYTYFYKESSANYWTLLREESAEETARFTPNAAGDYDLRVAAKDSSGNTAVKDFLVTVLEVYENTSTVDREYVVTGGVLTMQASAVGGTAPYTYAYYYSWDDGQTWNTAYDYSATTTLRMTLSSSGDYLIRIDVKDAEGEIASKYFNVLARDEVIYNVSYLEKETVKLGEEVVLHNAFEGGVGTAAYSVYYKLSGSTSWVTVSANSSASSTTFKPKALGTYEVRSVVTDVQGNTSETILSLEIVDEYFDVKLDNILSQILTPTMTELEKLKAIHDWMINYAEYDTVGYNSGNVSESSHTAKGFIENKTAVCDGYSETFLLLTQKAGFECVIVTGVAFNGTDDENHAWNQVKMDGKWYNVDVTWDDPVVTTASNTDNLTYRYFLIPDSVMNTNHSPASACNSCTTDQPAGELISMTLDEELRSHSDYAYCSTEAELKDSMQTFYDQGVKPFTLIYRTTQTDHNTIINTVAAQRPSGTGMNVSIIEWKFSGYYKITVTLT